MYKSTFEFRYIGCTFKRQTGSHKVYWKDGLLRPVIVPRKREIPVSIIRSDLRTLNLSPEEYLRILNEI